MPALIFPNTYTQEDGTDGNIFELFIAENEPLPFFDGPDTSFTHEINDGNYWISGTANYPEEERTTTQWFNFDVRTGLLHWIDIKESYANGSELVMSIGIVEQHTSGDDGGIPEGASFSALLDVGDKFTWTINTMKEKGTTVTTDPTNPLELGQGAIIELEVLKEPETFDIWSDTQDVDTFFSFKIDGTSVSIKDIFEEPGDFAQFIYPVIVDFQDGTITNFFEYIAAHPDEEFFGDSNTVTASITNNIFTLRIVESKDDGLRDVVQDFEFYVDTGVMISMYRTETWTNGTVELEIVITLTDEYYEGETTSDTTTPTDTDTTSDDGGSPIPATGIVWILPALIAIPILRRKR